MWRHHDQFRTAGLELAEVYLHQLVDHPPFAAGDAGHVNARRSADDSQPLGRMHERYGLGAVDDVLAGEAGDIGAGAANHRALNEDGFLLSTVDAIRSPATQGGPAADGLVYRYDPKAAPDGLPGVEGTFNTCSFWLVEALTRAGRTDPSRLASARLPFEQMLGYGNHLGLYAEQTGPSGEALGNFPQAFTHLALFSAASNLDRALAGRAE